MLKLNKVAVTGGLSCGKSSVCRYFKELGAHVVSADEIVHNLLTPQTSIGRDVIALLGNDILKEGNIDRSVIAKKVFNNPSLLQALEKLVHPIVLKEIEKQYQQAKNQGTAQLFVAEIPLLFEVAGQSQFDTTIAVLADPEICVQRFIKATGYGRDEYNKRMAQQLEPEEKAKKADYIINNSSNDTQDLLKQVETLFHHLTTG